MTAGSSAFSNVTTTLCALGEEFEAVHASTVVSVAHGCGLHPSVFR